MTGGGLLRMTEGRFFVAVLLRMTQGLRLCVVIHHVEEHGKLTSGYLVE